MNDIDERRAEVVSIELELERCLCLGAGASFEQQRQPRDRALAGAVAADEHGERSENNFLGPVKRAVVLERETSEVQHEERVPKSQESR
jgi:hypothetical protein